MSIRLPGYEETQQCPYEKSHIILKHRFQTHLIKCKRAHPEISLEICPFDQTHHVRKIDLDAHVGVCPSRGVFDLHVYNVNGGGRETVAPSPKPAMSQQHAAEDDWDHFECGTYDPKQHVEQKKVLRSAGLSTKSERRQFRDEERRRLSALEREQN